MQRKMKCLYLFTIKIHIFYFLLTFKYNLQNSLKIWTYAGLGIFYC